MRRKKKYIGSRVLIALLGLIYIVPFYILVVMSLKRQNDYTSKWLLPNYFTLENYINAWNSANIPRALTNNLIIMAGVVCLSVFLGAMAAYPLARRKTRINNTIYAVIISLIVLPSISISANLYKVMIDIKAIDTYWGVILVITAFSLPMVIFLYTGFISTIPRELEEAAMIDGCNRFSAFFRIILPLLKSSTITVVIFTGQAAWNDYAFALLYLQSPEKQNMTLTISTFFSEYHLELGWMSAGCIINALPLIVVFFCCQKYFIRGLTDGAVK